MSLLDSVKNKAASLALRALLNQHVSRYASLDDVKVDLARHSVLVWLTPLGESGCVSLEFRYLLGRDCHPSNNRLRVASAESNRRWVHLVLQDHLVGKEFDIPPAVAKFL